MELTATEVSALREKANKAFEAQPSYKADHREPFIQGYIARELEAKAPCIHKFFYFGDYPVRRCVHCYALENTGL